MTAYLNPKFTVGGQSSQQYRDNWERIFGSKDEPENPVLSLCACGHHEGLHVEKKTVEVAFKCSSCPCATYAPMLKMVIE